MLAVRDTGVGMDDETARHVFDPFFTTKPSGSGTGLGLAMVYGFVTQSGGHVAVETAEGRGTTLRIFLPRASHPVAAEGASGALPDRPTGAGTVLVVEDEEPVRALMARVLRECGYTVLECGNAREALPIGEHYDGRIDLLITDVVMPGLSGPDLARRLRRARPEMRTLFVSGYTDRAAEREAIAGAGTPLLGKPFGPDALAESVRHVLDSELARPAEGE